jgi:hypothetical protein
MIGLTRPLFVVWSLEVSDLLLEAQKRALLKLDSDKNAGGYFIHPAE